MKPKCHGKHIWGEWQFLFGNSTEAIRRCKRCGKQQRDKHGRHAGRTVKVK